MEAAVEQLWEAVETLTADTAHAVTAALGLPAARDGAHLGACGRPGTPWRRCKPLPPTCLRPSALTPRPAPALPCSPPQLLPSSPHPSSLLRLDLATPPLVRPPLANDAKRREAWATPLGRELSSEYVGWLAQSGQFDILRDFLSTESAPLAKVQAIRGMATDNFLFGRVQLLLHDNQTTEAMGILKRPQNCFAGFGGAAGTSRANLLDAYAVASLKLEQERLGRELTPSEQRHLRRQLNGLGEDGQEHGGKWGPPNLGVWAGAF